MVSATPTCGYLPDRSTQQLFGRRVSGLSTDVLGSALGETRTRDPSITVPTYLATRLVSHAYILM